MRGLATRGWEPLRGAVSGGRGAQGWLAAGTLHPCHQERLQQVLRGANLLFPRQKSPTAARSQECSF